MFDILTHTQQSTSSPDTLFCIEKVSSNDCVSFNLKDLVSKSVFLKVNIILTWVQYK